MSVFPPPGLAQLVTEIAALLISRNETLCMAETACGGLMSASLLSKPGSSKFYRGGVTLYTLESRLAYGGWTDRDIETYRGPTPNIVENLARHVGRTLNATYCLAESGTAGPTGGHTPNRIPGYCAFAVASNSGTLKSIEISTGSAERSQNQVAFAEAGLTLLLQTLKQAQTDGKGEKL